MKHIALTFLITCCFLSCSETKDLSETDKKNIIAEVESTLNKYYDDIRKKGLHAEFAYLDSFPGFYWIPPGYSAPISYDSVASLIKQNAVLFRSVDNRFETLLIVPLTGELANYTARLLSVITDTAGKRSSFTLVETGIMIKRKQGWKLLSGQTTITK